MKKIIALVLAIIMMASMSVVAFAAGETLEDIANEQDTKVEGTDGKIKVEYNVQKGYTVVIPENMELDVHDLGSETFGTKGYALVADKPAEIGAEEQTDANRVAILMAKLSKGETLKISISGNEVTGQDCNGADIKNKWMLIEKNDSAASVGYDIKITGDATIAELAQNVTVISYTSGVALPSDGIEAFLHLTTEKTSQPGIFEDTLTFTVAIANA